MKRALLVACGILLIACIVLGGALYRTHAIVEAMEQEILALQARLPVAASEDPIETIEGEHRRDMMEYTLAKRANRDYKLFYGEWEVTKLIEWGPIGQPREDIIGQRVYYDKNTFISNGKKLQEKFVYAITLLPVTDTPYYEYKSSPKQLGLEGAYFAFVTVVAEPLTFVIDEMPIIGDYFYVKDDETLIVSFGNNYYEMKRVRYIDNYEIHYVSP